MTCSCGYVFILNPKSDGYADGRIVAPFRKASAGGTRYFTSNQLATEVAGMRTVKWAGVIVGSSFLIASVASIWGNNDSPVIPIGIGIVGAVTIAFVIIAFTKRLDTSQLDRAVKNSKPMGRLARIFYETTVLWRNYLQHGENQTSTITVSKEF
jgi:hypothetical protein